ncbi:MAG: hypothetical protein K6L73_12870 [Cellvibrionaceae bacterium]
MKIGRDERSFIAWLDVLEFYAHDWDETFENRRGYYTQEFWYLLIGCVVNYWKGSPMTVSRACQMMKSGSSRTREERIKKAVVDGYIEKQKHPGDGREIILVPTDKLEDMIKSHLQRTMQHMFDTFNQVDGISISMAKD